MSLKPWHWIVILLVTAGLIVMAPSDEGEVTKKGTRSDKTVSKAAVGSSSISVPTRESAGESGRVELEILSKIELQHKEKSRVSDVFNQTSWYVAPPPPPKSLEPPPPPKIETPVAPQLPFTYLGRYGDDEKRTVILSKGDKVYTVVEGDIIENTYRVEKLTKGTVNMTYLPLNFLQSLRTGEAL